MAAARSAMMPDQRCFRFSLFACLRAFFSAFILALTPPSTVVPVGLVSKRLPDVCGAGGAVFI